MKPPDVVPDAVIESIAGKHVLYERQGECPEHDHKWNGRYVSPWKDHNGAHAGDREVLPCTCVVKMARFQDILKALCWSGDHYSFDFAGMYVGVELDGYMHT